RSRRNVQRLQEFFPQDLARMDGAHSVNCHGATSSVVIDYFNIRWARVCPLETDAELIVNPDAVLTCSVALQRFQAVTRWRAQVSKLCSSVQHRQLSGCDAQNIFPAP